MQGTAQDIGIGVVTMTFAEFSVRVIELLKEAQDASNEIDRIIAVSKIQACATEYLGDLWPAGTSEYSAMQSQAVGSAKKKTQATKAVAAKSEMLF